MRWLHIFVVFAIASVLYTIPLSAATPTSTASPTSTRTATPVIAAYVASVAYSYANTPIITIPYVPSPSGNQELLCVVLGTNSTDYSSVVTQVSFGGVNFTNQLQVSSEKYSEGIELWTLSLGSPPYPISGNIVITQPATNTIINTNVTIVEYRGAAQSSILKVNWNVSPQTANQSSTLATSLLSLFQNSFIMASYSGVKGLTTYPANFTNLQYIHRYGMWQSFDHRGPVAPATYNGSYTALPPNNPAASVMMAEIPSYSFITPTPAPTATNTPTVP